MANLEEELVAVVVVGMTVKKGRSNCAAAPDVQIFLHSSSFFLFFGNHSTLDFASGSISLPAGTQKYETATNSALIGPEPSRRARNRQYDQLSAVSPWEGHETRQADW